MGGTPAFILEPFPCVNSPSGGARVLNPQEGKSPDLHVDQSNLVCEKTKTWRADIDGALGSDRLAPAPRPGRSHLAPAHLTETWSEKHGRARTQP